MGSALSPNVLDICRRILAAPIDVCSVWRSVALCKTVAFVVYICVRAG